MRRVALIYNPASGQYSARRKVAIQEAVAVLREGGAVADAFETSTPGSGAVLAADAVRQGCDTVLACGGDGTVNEVLQSLTGTDVALGVVPLGTANALATNLGLVGPPAKVARHLLEAVPVRVPVGRVHFQDQTGNRASRYFTVAAGVGVDALLMSQLDAGLKRRFGYIVYLVEAFRIWATASFPLFQATFPGNASGPPRVAELSQLLVVRVHSFGGVLRELAPGATLHDDSLRLLAFRTRSRFRYLKFLLAVTVGRHSFSHDIELVDTPWVECRPCDGSKLSILVEVDGEFLGSLPVRIEMVPDALTLLMAPHAQP